MLHKAKSVHNVGELTNVTNFMFVRVHCKLIKSQTYMTSTHKKSLNYDDHVNLLFSKMH